MALTVTASFGKRSLAKRLPSCVLSGRSYMGEREAVARPLQGWRGC